MPQLYVEDVTLTFGGVNALSNVSLQVPENERYVISDVGSAASRELVYVRSAGSGASLKADQDVQRLCCLNRVGVV